MITFEKWCLLNDKQPIPASPTLISRFIEDVAGMGIERVWEAVQEISRAHYLIGLPDPTLGAGLVTNAINKLSGVQPPRSWTKEMQTRFLSLPFDVQNEIGRREAERDAVLRRAQNEVAELKKHAAVAA
jgi:hypothetical protein